MKYLAALLLILVLAACDAPVHGKVQSKGYQERRPYILNGSIRIAPEQWYLTVCDTKGECTNVGVSKEEFDQANIGDDYGSNP